MSVLEKEGIHEFGWGYFEMQTWHQCRHGECPFQMQRQIAAVAVSINELLPRDLGHVVDLLCAAIDTYNRPHMYKCGM